MLYTASRPSYSHVHRLAVRKEEPVKMRRTPGQEEIAMLAYSYWEAGGRRDGAALSDWLRAERALSD